MEAALQHLDLTTPPQSLNLKTTAWSVSWDVQVIVTMPSQVSRILWSMDGSQTTRVVDHRAHTYPAK